MNSIKQDNDKKKRWLSRYTYLKKQTEIARDVIRELEIIGPPPINYSGMPSSHSQKDLSDYTIKHQASLSRYLKKLGETERTLLEIEEAINTLEKEEEKTVLKLRYLKNMSMKMICKEINYSWAQTNRYHSNALIHFKIPEDDTQ